MQRGKINDNWGIVVLELMNQTVEEEEEPESKGDVRIEGEEKETTKKDKVDCFSKSLK